MTADPVPGGVVYVQCFPPPGHVNAGLLTATHCDRTLRSRMEA